MADYRIKAQKTGPRTFAKELQLISYRGSALFNESGAPLIAEKDVYYPPDYLSDGATAVVLDSESYKESGFSTQNRFSTGLPAALPIEEQFSEESQVSRSLLGINRAETQQGLFGNVSTYGLDRKDWIIYSDSGSRIQRFIWENKDSPTGLYFRSRDTDNAKGSAIELTTNPIPYLDPGNDPVFRLRTGDTSGSVSASWTRYVQSLVALYIIEYMVNNFSDADKLKFGVSYIDKTYPKTSDGKFNRLYWDTIWLDIDQGRVPNESDIPAIPLGEFRNFGVVGPSDSPETIDIKALYNSDILVDEKDQDIKFSDIFFATTRYTWDTQTNQGHYQIKTNQDTDVWQEYWAIDFENDVPEEVKNWEFQVYESELDIPSYVIENKLPYYLITDKENAYDSLLFGESWPKSFSDSLIPQITEKLTEGNQIGSSPTEFSTITLQSTKSFRYQPGRISGFTYGVKVSEEGAGPGSILEFGVENYSDGYFFRLKDGTDFSIIRRSTVSLGSTPLFINAQYNEREGYVDRITGVINYKDILTEEEIESFDRRVEDGSFYVAFETSIEQNIMNGDGLDNQGASGYIYNPDTVTMYKIEFGWYGAIGARFYAYIPQGNGESRWVTLHTLVIENQLGQPCLEDPYFFFKYRVYVGSPEALRLPQFIEKYGASYYIDGGDEGTVDLSSGSAIGRPIIDVEEIDFQNTFPISKWSTVLGLKPKKFLVNTEGTELFNKKEILPVSLSVVSTKDAEIKLINQFGCQEHAYTFQEGFRCSLSEKQRLRGRFVINRYLTDETSLQALNRQQRPTPTITYVGPVDPSVYPESFDNLGNTSFIGWDGLQGGLLGAKIISDKLYCAYVNPQEQGDSTPSFIDANTTIISRNTEDSVFSGYVRNQTLTNGPLLFRYSQEQEIKLSAYRKDTTLISTVDINTEEFYLFFTSSNGGSGFDSYQEADTIENFEIICSNASGCDEKHVADFQIGLIWPTSDSTVAPSVNFSYPKSLIHTERIGKDFGILNPLDSEAQAANWTNEPVELKQNGSGDWYVEDKQIPNSDEFRYYEGLPIDVSDPSLESNTIILNQQGRVSVSPSGFENGEIFFNGSNESLGIIDSRLPGVPGQDGGRCRALYCNAGQVREEGTFVNSNGLFLSKSSSWEQDLQIVGQTIFVENINTGSEILVEVQGAQEIFEVPNTSLREFRLPVNVIAPGTPFGNETEVLFKYRAISIYRTTLVSKTAGLFSRKVVGAVPFPLRFFLRFKEGAEIGSVVIGKNTSNGIVQVPFTPHGCTLNTSETDDVQTHSGAANSPVFAAQKHVGIFSEPDTLVGNLNYSYYDVSTADPDDKSKKCTSFVSRNTLAGAGFSSTGDYPLRSLKFKDSGDPVGSYYLSANTPTEIDLKDIFGVGKESIGANFWGNKAFFIIARDIDLNPALQGRISVTLNYKEQ